MENKKVLQINPNDSGYQKYGYNITKYMSNVFPYVKLAYVCFYADSITEAKMRGKDYFSKKDIKNQSFDYSGDEIIIEFTDGKIVSLSNSEWGWISVKG